MRAVTILEASGERWLGIARHVAPTPAPDEVTVVVQAISLNNGEIREALAAPAGHRPGWDFADVIEAAPDGSDFAVGDRVVGHKFEGAWAKRAAVLPNFLAKIPDEVGFEAAAVLPVAGMTAAIALSKRMLTRGDKVLVAAATGGVGLIAVQLAAAAGAHVTAFLRAETDAALLRRLPVHAIAIGEGEAERGGPYDLIIEGVGGKLLGSALSWLAPRGMCVQFGDAAGDEPTTFDAKAFRLGSGGTYGGTPLYGLFPGEELTRPQPAHASILLSDLAARLTDGTLDPVINQRGSWRDIDEVSCALMSRQFKGTAVLTVD